MEKINDFIYQARGIGNTHVITTSAGHVLFDTGLSLQAARQLQMLQEVMPAGDITHIIASHSHADHIGGIKFWRQPDTEILAHAEYAEEQRYLKELEQYFWKRNQRAVGTTEYYRQQPGQCRNQCQQRGPGLSLAPAGFPGNARQSYATG